jgi:hypothetical protein
MFDPTAFENMKVVMEGIFYDKDLSGEIVIVDRNDLINTAKLSRSYDLSFQLPLAKKEKVTCKFTLSAGVENLTAELLEISADLAGCTAKIEFFTQHEYIEPLFLHIEELLSGIWGKKRAISLMVCRNSIKSNEKVLYTGTISLNRIIQEDQLDDLTEMTDYMIMTLDKLEEIFLS